MDQTDEKILTLLQGNARMTFQELGDALGISRVAVRKRVLKLEKEGIIQGYNTYIKRPGEVMAFIDIRVKKDCMDDVLEYILTEVTGVRQVFKSIKGDGLRVIMVADSLEELDYFSKNAVKKIEKKLTKFLVYIMGDTIKDVYSNL